MFERFFKPGKKTVLRSSAPEPAPSAGAGAGEAVAALSRAINGALQHHQAGRLSEAEAAYREALAIDPENIDALHFLGVIAFQRAEHERAAELISRALSRNASNAPAHNNLGNVFLAQGKLDEAIACYRKAVELAPGYVDPHFNMGNIFKMQGKLDEAVACSQRVLTLMPDSPIAHSNLGNMLVEQGKRNEAIACYQKAIELKPDFPEAYSNLGSVLRDQGRLDEAIACYEQALKLKPDFPQAHYNLGNVLKDVGRPEDAVRSYRQALALKPDAETHSALLFSLNYIPGLCPADIYAEHRDYARCLYPIVASQLHDNIPDPGRRLRIGYVSGDFRMHPVAHFIEPVLAQHDHDRFEISCYYNYNQTDAFTERLRNHADSWRDVVALNDEALAGLIRNDAIDILVDLSGHSGKNRLPVFGRKPAPVQATWLGYLNTTGLEAIDYRITDRYASPEGLFDAFHSERLLRLPGSQWCYQPPLNCPEVSDPPSAKTSGVTFAAFSNLAKIGRPVIELWSRLLARVPGSRLLIVAPGLASIHEEYLRRFTGVAVERIELQDIRPFRDYLDLHGAADVMLDTFPYTGGTTTCHALWMGVPLVSLVGDTAPSRGGASVLNVIGLGELVAQTPEEYLDIAAGLAADPARLAALRSGMRARMAASALMDAERFTRNLEEAYRFMWQSWCKRR